MDERLNLNTAEIDQILDTAHVSRRLCDAVLAHRPYPDAEALLRVEEIRNLATDDELIRLMTLHNEALVSAAGVETAVGVRAALVDDEALAGSADNYEFEGLKLRVARFDREGEQLNRYMIAEQDGTELVCAAFSSDGKLDESTVRFFGMPIWELGQLPKSKTEALLKTIACKDCQQAAYMFRRELPDAMSDECQNRFSKISQLLVNFVGFARINRGPQQAEVRRHAALAMEAADDDIPVNGCTLAPDFDFESCCNDHDRCYARGGNDANREQCDQVLKNCIQSKGHPILAVIYHQAVRVFGGFFFEG